MIEEAYCSNEVAKLLKEKGFNESCVRFAYQLKDRVKYGMNKDCPTNTDLKPIYASAWSVPTHQMAMAWLREKNISIEMSVVKSHYWVYTIYKILNNKVKELYNDGGFESYENACESALEYCLKNLI